MSWREDLTVPAVMAHPSYRRLCVLCAEDFPETHTRDSYRALVARLAAGVVELGVPVVALAVSVDYGESVMPARCCGG